MGIAEIFGLQFFMSFVIWGLLAYWLALPWLRTKPRNETLFFLTIPHAFRHIGMVFLVPGVVTNPLPGNFAYEAGYGDLAAGVLAIIALIALRLNWRAALGLVWLFNIIGTVDLINALSHENVIADMGATWYIPTMFVPLLLVTHAMIFMWLVKGDK